MFGRVQQTNNVCRFYQQGRCKFGNSCKYDHPGANNAPQGNQNSFAALSNNQGSSRGNDNSNRPGGLARGDHYRPGGSPLGQTLPYLITKDGIVSDLKYEKPQWPFSAYGPGRDAPRQLFEGFPLEQSFEEMRVMHYLAVAQGSEPEAIRNEQELLQKSTLQVEQVLNDLDGAIKYVIDGKDVHPNRLDMCQGPGPGMQPPQHVALTQTGSTGPSTFGANAPKPAFGQAAFGAPSQLGTFGKPSALNQGSAFGQASAVGQGGTFGQTSALGSGGGTFGQTSALGSGGGTFGQASALGSGGGTFGQASALGSGVGAFGKPSALGSSGGTFGQASALGTKPTWGQSPAPAQNTAFGQSAALGQQSSPFALAAQNGSGSGFGASSQPANSASPFATATAGTNEQPGQTGVFGRSSGFGTGTANGAQNSSPFGQPQVPASQGSGFGGPAPGAQSSNGNTNPFGSQPTQPPQQSSAFSQVAPAQSNSPFGQLPTNPAFGQTSQPQPPNPALSGPGAFSQQPQAPTSSPFAQIQQPQSNGTVALSNNTSGPMSTPDPSTYTTRNPDNSLRSWKNRPVQYLQDQAPYFASNDGKLERIWHPNGPPPPNPDIEDPPGMYNAVLEAAYAFVMETGTFKDGIMPDVPPKREWIRYDV